MEPEPRPDPTTYLGGSDAAALCGIHPYKTPGDVVKEKIGLKEQPEKSYRMDKGLYLESLISDWYTTQTGTSLDKIKFCRHAEHEHLGGHPDRIRVRDGKTQLVEIKTTQDWNLYKDLEVPPWHKAQLYHYAMVLKSYPDLDLHPEALVIVDRGQAEPEVIPVELDYDKLDKLRDEELAFWISYVETRVLPDPHNTIEALGRWPDTTEEVVEFSESDLLLLAQYHAIKATQKKDKEDLESVRLQLMRKMGEAGDGTYKGKIVCTWHKRSTTRLSTKSLQADPEAAALVEKHTFTNDTRVLLPKKVKS